MKKLIITFVLIQLLSIDQGNWVNAQFTSTLKNPKGDVVREVFYEFYHIVDGKIASWNQFKRDEKN